MTWADTLGNMAALDRWRAAVGVTYPADAANTPSGAPAAVPDPGDP